MPVSALLRGLLERCFLPERVNPIFEHHAREQYTQQLLFSTLCDLLLQVVLRVQPSVHAAYQAQAEDLEVSAAALYDNLKGVEVRVSAGLVGDTARDLASIQAALGGKRREWLPGYRVRLLDGNCLEGSEKRLKVQRGQSGTALPGKSRVVLDAESGLLTEVFPCEDGHAQERSLLPAVLLTIRAGELWIADRNFCVMHFLFGIEDRHARFLFRLHGHLSVIELDGWNAPVMTEDGQRVTEQRVQVGERQYRRIRVELTEPTRDGDTFIDLLSSMPEDIDSVTLATLYRRRWTLETAFQKLEAHLESEINTLAYPRAALLGFCLALMVYNIFEVMLAAIDSVHDEPVAHTLSTYYVANDIASTFLALLMLSEDGDWAFLSALPAHDFAQWLRSVAAHINIKKYRKHVRGPKKPPPKKTYDTKQPHFSTQRLLHPSKK